MAVIVQSYNEFKDDFVKMIDQIEKEDYSQIDAWCHRLGAGVKTNKKKK